MALAWDWGAKPDGIQMSIWSRASSDSFSAASSASMRSAASSLMHSDLRDCIIGIVAQPSQQGRSIRSSLDR